MSRMKNIGTVCIIAFACKIRHNFLFVFLQTSNASLMSTRYYCGITSAAASMPLPLKSYQRLARSERLHLRTRVTVTQTFAYGLRSSRGPGYAIPS